MPDFRKTLAMLAKLDWMAFAIQMGLAAVGIAFIHAVGVEIGGEMAGKWIRQIFWFGMGLVIYFSLALTDYRLLARNSWGVFAALMLVMLYAAIFGAELNGARSWIKIGHTFLQPSEFAKPVTLLFMAWAITHKAWDGSPVPSWLLTGLICAVPVLLIAIQPDFGTALVFLPFSFALAFLRGLKWRWIFLGILAAALAAPPVYAFLRPHQKERINVFLEPHAEAILAISRKFLPQDCFERLSAAQKEFLQTKDAEGAARKHDNWNAEQAMLAVGSGGFFGKGYLKGTQHTLGYLPKTVAPTDFIFSVIAEETGFMGSMLILCAFAALILCACHTALAARDQLGVCLAAGAAVIYATHVVINIGMTVQMMPIVGIPLPFISYGGSFMISTMMLAGLCQSVHIHHHTQETQDDDEELP